jgi:hypothetical protein
LGNQPGSLPAEDARNEQMPQTNLCRVSFVKLIRVAHAPVWCGPLGMCCGHNTNSRNYIIQLAACSHVRSQLQQSMQHILQESLVEHGCWLFCAVQASLVRGALTSAHMCRGRRLDTWVTLQQA